MRNVWHCEGLVANFSSGACVGRLIVADISLVLRVYDGL